MGEELDRGHLSMRRYTQFFCLFDVYLAAMLLAVNLENIAIMWIAIEGSTLSAALLIGFDRSKAALEAGWKYVILSSVGIALAFATLLYQVLRMARGAPSEAGIALGRQCRLFTGAAVGSTSLCWEPSVCTSRRRWRPCWRPS